MIVGFAAETASNDVDLIRLAAAKLRRKGCDLLVVNDVGGALQVFGGDQNQVTILDGQGVKAQIGPDDKATIAHGILDAVRDRLGEAPTMGGMAPTD